MAPDSPALQGLWECWSCRFSQPVLKGMQTSAYSLIFVASVRVCRGLISGWLSLPVCLEIHHNDRTQACLLSNQLANVKMSHRMLSLCSIASKHRQRSFSAD